MSTTPPGWYDDGSGTQRWWDGSSWTEHVQPQSPAGYPGYAGQAPSAPSAPSSPDAPAQKSKLWIVFVVLGVLVIGLIVLAAVFIPRIIGSFVTSGGAAGDSEAERAAILTVERYDEAWNEADCDLYLAATTEDYRVAIGMTDCAAFEAEAQIFGESTDEYEISVDSVEREDDVITVFTTETFLSLIDEDDQPLATPEPVSTPYEYTLVPAGDGWAIDDVW